jgi:hypothetical protein
MPGKMVGNNLPKVHSVLQSYCSEVLQAVQNYPLSRRSAYSGTREHHTDTNQIMMDVPTLEAYLFTRQKILFPECTTINVPEIWKKNIIVWKPLRKRSLGRPKKRWEDNLKLYLKGMCCDGGRRMEIA